MNKKEKTRNLKFKELLYCCGFVGFFASGTICEMTDYHQLQKPILTISTIILVFVTGILKKHRGLNEIISTSYNLSYFLFFVSILFSFIVHFELGIIINAFGIIVIWWVTNWTMPYARSKGICSLQKEWFLLIAFQFLILGYTIVNSNITINRFQGIFYNSNATGGAGATLCAVALPYFLFTYLNRKKGDSIKLILSAFVIAFSVFISLISTSRTSILTIAGMFMLMFVLMLKEIKNKKRLLRVVLIIVVATIGLFIVLKSEFVQSILNVIIEKFVLRKGNEFAGRQNRWDVVFERLSFFGNGEETAIGTHNTFLGFLDQYGYIAIASWISYITFALFNSFKIAFSKSINQMKYLPLFSFFCFFLLSMFEGMMLKTIMLICLYSGNIIYTIKKELGVRGNYKSLIEQERIK